MGRTLYITDLDGTLLNRSDRISRESLKIINGLIERGMLFTYATARSLVSASVVTAGLRITIPVIVYNGAFIIDPLTGERLDSEGFQEDEIRHVTEVLNRYCGNPLVYACVEGQEKVSWLRGRENDGIRRYLEKRRGDRRLRPVTDQRQLYEGEPFYFTCIGEREELLPVYAVFAEDPGFRCTLQQELYRPEYWCEIMPARATKAFAIQKIRKRLGCGRVVSFGDSINDIPMFQASDEAYAVSNGAEELIKAAAAMIGSNDEDGVARWLQQNIRM